MALYFSPPDMNLSPGRGLLSTGHYSLKYFSLVINASVSGDMDSMKALTEANKSFVPEKGTFEALLPLDP